MATLLIEAVVVGDLILEGLLVISSLAFLNSVITAVILHLVTKGKLLQDARPHPMAHHFVA